MKIIIIGAGPSGLVALKEFREAGFDAMVLEKSSGIGGALREGYENLYLTTSNRLTGYSDFPDQSRLKYSSHEEYMDYLESYASFFGLKKNITFDTAVTSAKLNASGNWEIQAKQAGKVIHLVADRLIVATGSNHIPKYAPTPGYSGEIMHSSEWRDNKEVTGKRVLVIGNGESAGDVSAEAAKVANSVALWTRKPICMAPRFVNLKSNDELAWLKKQHEEPPQVWELLETTTVTQVSQLQSAKDYSDERMVLFKMGKEMGGKDALSLLGSISYNASTNVPEGVQGSDQLFVVTKTSRMATAVATAGVDLFIARRASFCGKKVTFSELSQKNFEWPIASSHQETYEADIIVMCTGFKTNFDWLDVEIDWNPRTWFKNCIPIGYEDKLAFLGWTRGHQGGIPAMSEMLSRYLALLYSGLRTLPENWQETIKTEKEVSEKYYALASGNNTLVDYPSFMLSVARLIGCEPRRPSIFNLRRFIKYYTFPLWPMFYRTHGPGARPEILGHVLDQHGTFEAISPRGTWKRALFQVAFLNPVFYLFSFFGTKAQNMGYGWYWAKSKRFVGLHGLNIRFKEVLLP
mmetsp:Transcript_25930/g.54785  ORF Transcript_25930/g.54785 Transcript_25930/m.54785 type:complete len:577 (-) Transcript_25930:163-1893(-)